MRRGYALLVVLWALVVVGALAAEFHVAARADRLGAANLRAATAAKWAARAGLAWTAAELDRRTAGPNAALELARAGDAIVPDTTLDVGALPTRVRVRDARARLNVNRAGVAEWTRLLGALGLPEPAATAAARRIAARAGMYRSADDVRDAAGLPVPLLRELARYLTAAGDGRINVNSAPVPVLRTLPVIDSAAAAAIVERRRVAPLRTVFDIISALPAGRRDAALRALAVLESRTAFGPREVEIVTTATVPGTGIRVEARATALLAGADRVSLLRVVER
ncbi:MAG TPA: type II secretion system protein GspK [Longimicrobiales bacterium]